MSAVIQCPSCGARTSFGGRVPRDYTCRACGLALDLSAFSDPASPPAGPVARPPATTGAPRRPHARHVHRTDPTRVWLALGLGALVVAVVVVVAVSRSGTEQLSPAERVQTSAQENDPLRPVIPAPPSPSPSAPQPIPAAPRASPPPTPAATPPPPRAPEAAPPAPSPQPPPATPKPPPGPRRIPGDIIADSPVPADQEIRTWPYGDDVTAEERNRIEDALRLALDFGGSDGMRAEKAIAALGMKAVPRLIGEFRAVIDRYGLDRPEGLMRAMVLDRLLRKVDGVQERLFHDYLPIDVDRNQPRATRTVQNWNWWWATEEWKKNPRKPWDPKVDEKDLPED